MQKTIALIKVYWHKLRSSSDKAFLARGVGIVFIIQTLGYGLNYLMTVLLARWLGTADFGTYAYATNWVHFVAILGGVGLTVGSLKFVPQYKSAQDWGGLKGIIRYSTSVVFMASVGLTCLLMLWLVLVPPPDMNMQALLVGIWITPLFALESLYINVVRGLKYVGAAYFPSVILRPIITILLALVCLAFIPNNALAGLTAFGIAVMTSTVIEIGFALRDLRRLPKDIAPTFHVREWSKVSFSLMGLEINSVILARVSVVLVGVFLSPKAVALFTVAERTASLTSFILMSANAVFAPMIAPLYKNGQMKKLENLVMSITQWTFLSALGLSLGLALFSEFLLGLFGEEYVEAQTVLLIVIIGHLINASTGPVSYLLTLTEYQKEILKYRVVVSITSLILSFTLIPLFGIVGAAIARAYGQTGGNLVSYWLVRKHLKIDTLGFVKNWVRLLPFVKN